MKCTECQKELTMGEEEYYHKSVREKYNLPPQCYQCAERERQDKRLKIRQKYENIHS